jgi:hypothetical protein
LSEPQRQALDALCVYALLEANVAINDPRLSVHGNTLPALLDRLRTFDLTSDAEKMNRPLTYRRSLRAASLAVYDRPADRAVLKDDVAWLVKAEIGGGYTYDDFYNEMIRRGFRPRLDSQTTPQASPSTKPATMPVLRLPPSGIDNVRDHCRGCPSGTGLPGSTTAALAAKNLTFTVLTRRFTI